MPVTKMKLLKILCAIGFLAVLASNVWTISRWNETRGVCDDLCYLRQAHLFERFGLAVSIPISCGTTTAISRAN